MSDTQTVWMILWNRATSEAPHFDPFELSEVAPQVAEALRISNQDARRLIVALLNELGRLPDGQRYFALEGNAVVPLPEIARVPETAKGEFEAYPFEL